MGDHRPRPPNFPIRRGADRRLSTEFVTDARSERLTLVLREAGARAARFHCSDRIAVTAREKQELRSRTGADAVEMESAVVHEVCARRGIPSATLRSISDVATEDMALDFNLLATADFELSPLRLGWAILRTPSSIPGLVRLGRQSAFAARELAGVLRRVLGQG